MRCENWRYVEVLFIQNVALVTLISFEIDTFALQHYTSNTSVEMTDEMFKVFVNS